MSQFTGLLRQLTKKASHPNALIYQVQMEHARHKYLVRGQLEDGKEGAVALGAPESEEEVLARAQEQGRDVEVDGVATETRNEEGAMEGKDSSADGEGDVAERSEKERGVTDGSQAGRSWGQS